MISFGYQCGTLPTTLQVKGLHCPRIGEHCWRACECWPVKSVVDFEHDGSSSLLTRVGKFHSLDVCVGRNEIVELLEERPGGVEAVSTSNTLDKILCRCNRTFIGFNEHKNLWLVTMSQSTMRDLLGAHQSGLIYTEHPWEKFVLLHSAQKCLDECGLGYRDALFPGHKDLVNEFLPYFAERFNSRALLECLHLVEDMITTHTQQIFDSGLVAELVKGLDFDPPYDDDYTPEERTRRRALKPVP
ncbi:hypothetical protein ACHAXN_007043 [Cyclotella atomus]